MQTTVPATDSGSVDEPQPKGDVAEFHFHAVERVANHLGVPLRGVVRIALFVCLSH
jgi:hypothetical protein